jgi:alkylhydroperoxidase family enzyme
MPRIPEVSDANASPEQAALFERDRAASGDVYNPTRIYAHRPGVAKALGELHQALAAGGGVPAALASLVRVRVAQIHGCPF